METKTITKKDGTPFPTKASAQARAGTLKLEGHTVKELGERQFVIETPVVEDTPQAEHSDAPQEELEEAVEVKSGEEPAKKHKVTKPWTPSRKLDIPEHLKDSRFIYRFVNKDKQGRVRQLENDGYEVDTELQKKMSGYEKKHGQNLDITLQVNELIVMRILKTEYEAHRKYYSDLTNNARSQDEEEVKDEMNKSQGISMYRPAGANMN